MVNKVQFTDSSRGLLLGQTQTPKQRIANEKFAKNEASKRGKHENIAKSKREVKSPVSTGWIGMC
jgi:Ribosome associated membrane protein RAMP4